MWHFLCLHQICGCINYYCRSSWQISYTGFLPVVSVIAQPISHYLSTRCSKSWISCIHFINQSPWTSLQQLSQQEIVQPKLYFYDKKKSLISHYIHWARNKEREESSHLFQLFIFVWHEKIVHCWNIIRPDKRQPSTSTGSSFPIRRAHPGLPVGYGHKLCQFSFCTSVKIPTVYILCTDVVPLCLGTNERLDKRQWLKTEQEQI